MHDTCVNCDSTNIEENPTVIECEDGTIETNYDTWDARCRDCGKEWIIV